MNIHQMSVRYVPEQDRMLLSVNTSEGQELDLWLTRRMCLGLLPQLNRISVDHLSVPEDAKSDGFVDPAKLDVHTRKMLADFRRQELLHTADFKTPYRAGTNLRPQGQAPLLATEITMTPGSSQQVKIEFKELPGTADAGRAVQLVLQAQLVFGLLQMLSQALVQTQWLQAVEMSDMPHLAAMGSTLIAADPNDDSVVPDTTQPRYLN